MVYLHMNPDLYEQANALMTPDKVKEQFMKLSLSPKA